MKTIRSFIALPISSVVKSQIAALIATLQSIPSPVKWEDPEKVHLTLCFLGNVDPAFIEELSSKLTGILSYHSPFEMTCDGLGSFPSINRPRVFWVGVRSDDPLIRLQRDIEGAVTSLGLPREEREFHPHLTIGRAKGFLPDDRLTAMVKSLTFEPVSTLCREVTIMKSELRPTGSRYSVLHSIPLHS